MGLSTEHRYVVVKVVDLDSHVIFFKKKNEEEKLDCFTFFNDLDRKY